MKIFHKILFGLILASISIVAMQQDDVKEIWYDQDSPLYGTNFGRTVEGYRILILSGPDQNGYFVRLIFFLDGPKKGSIIVDCDDYRYQERQTHDTDKILFEYLQQRYQEQNLPEKG